MKILLFLNNDIHSATALILLLPTLKNHEVKIILSQKVGNVEGLPAELVAMKNLEKCQFDWSKFGFEVSSYEKVNSEKALTDFRNFAPDLIVSIRFGQIFKEPLIAIPKLGVLNLHSGILPQYRGILASFWAILNGEKNIGTTLHYINNSGIDNGEIIGFSNEEIDWNSSLLLNVNKLYKRGCEMIKTTLEKISNGEKIITKKQEDFGEAKYFSYPKSQDVESFLKLMPLAQKEDLEKIFI